MGWGKSEIKRFGREKDLEVEVLTYRDASQIYAFNDEFNSSREEISEVIGKSARVVDYAFDNREEIEKVLIKYLKILFPRQDIDKPYR